MKRKYPPVDLSQRVMLHVEVIPQDKQRYPTVGDWAFDLLGSLQMKISDMKNPDYEFMVMIHEAVEAWICRKRGITGQVVDTWDIGEGKHLEDPGAHPDCPYHREHMLALRIERMIAEELNINWDKYEQCLADTCPTEESSMEDSE